MVKIARSEREKERQREREREREGARNHHLALIPPPSFLELAGLAGSAAW
jgi:hypothetical protein